MVRDRIIVERASDVESEEKYPRAKSIEMVTARGVEKRIVLGKPRDCKIVSGKVSDVYDEFAKRYLPLNEFLKLYNEKGERLGIENVKKVEDKKEKEDKILERLIVPMNIATTSISTSGTSGVDILVPDIQINIDIEKEKEKIEDTDPYSWYVKKVLRRDI